MSIKRLIKTIQPRSMPYCAQLFELIKKLKPLSIDGMAYSVFQDTANHSAIRSSFFYSSEQLLGSYINDIDNWNEDHFYENQKYPLNKTTFYRPDDPRYQTILTQDSPMWKATADHGIGQSFCICLRNELQKKTELFWFYTRSTESHWIMRQIEHISTVKKFILYFKNEMETIVNTSLLNEEEWRYFSKTVVNKNGPLDNTLQNLEQPIIDIPVKKYHLGYPFSAPLSIKEFEVLKLYFSGYSAERTAKNCSASKRTVEKHLENILVKSTLTSLKELRVVLFDCPLFYDLI